MEVESVGLGHDPGCFLFCFVLFCFVFVLFSSYGGRECGLGHDPGCFLFSFLFCLVFMEVESVGLGHDPGLCFVLSFFVLFCSYGGRECGIGK